MTSRPLARAASDAAAVIGGGALLVAVAAATSAFAAGPAKSTAPPGFDAKGPETTLERAPRLRRVRIEMTPGAATVTHDLAFEAGALRTKPPGGDPLLYLAFNAQDRPLAVEIVRLDVDDAGAPVEGATTPLAFENVNARPPAAALVLGAGKSAGQVVRMPHLDHPDAPFILRVRSAIALAPGLREVSLMARLGVRDAAPIAIDRIEIVGGMGIAVRGARAWLCNGAHSDPRPLRVSFPGYPDEPDAGGVIPPASVVRSADDDLCVDVLE